jgi:hypothetical protein
VTGLRRASADRAKHPDEGKKCKSGLEVSTSIHQSADTDEANMLLFKPLNKAM